MNVKVSCKSGTQPTFPYIERERCAAKKLVSTLLGYGQFLCTTFGVLLWLHLQT